MFVDIVAFHYSILVVVQCVLYESAITFGSSKHSRTFLIGPEARSNPVFSWFWKEVMKARSRLRNVFEKIF